MIYLNNLLIFFNLIFFNLFLVGFCVYLMRVGVEFLVDFDLELYDCDVYDDEYFGLGLFLYDLVGVIMLVMLVNCYLFEILLGQGLLLICYIMGYLIIMVFGFVGILFVKVWRLVVVVLEGKGNGGVGSGLDGDVEFIKVGWGWWYVKWRGQGSRVIVVVYDFFLCCMLFGGSFYLISIFINKGGFGWYYLDWF